MPVVSESLPLFKSAETKVSVVPALPVIKTFPSFTVGVALLPAGAWNIRFVPVPPVLVAAVIISGEGEADDAG